MRAAAWSSNETWPVMLTGTTRREPDVRDVFTVHGHEREGEFRGADGRARRDRTRSVFAFARNT